MSIKANHDVPSWNGPAVPLPCRLGTWQWRQRQGAASCPRTAMLCTTANGPPANSRWVIRVVLRALARCRLLPPRATVSATCGSGRNGQSRHPSLKLERPPIEAASGIAQDDELAHERQPGAVEPRAVLDNSRSFGPLAGDACRAAPGRTPIAQGGHLVPQ
jgi:hypothetical protein